MTWTDEIILAELKELKTSLGHFPTTDEFYSLGASELFVEVDKHGGMDKFRVLLGDDPIIIPTSHWTDESIIRDLKTIRKKIGHHPNNKELHSMGRGDLNGAIGKHGGSLKYRALLGEELMFVKWTGERIFNELDRIMEQIGHFPSIGDLRKLGETKLLVAINRMGGNNNIREAYGIDPITFPHSYWTQDKLVNELKELTTTLGHFPEWANFREANKMNVYSAICNYGGMNLYRTLLGYEPVEPRSHAKRWTPETVLAEMEMIQAQIGTFPAIKELRALDRTDLADAVSRQGGFKKFREILTGDTTHKRGGYRWNDEKVLAEMKRIQAQIGTFPGTKELRELGRTDLMDAISNRGGFKKYRTLLKD